MSTKAKIKYFKNRPIPNPNPERAFAPSTRYSDLSSFDFEKAVKAFEKRIKHWYFDHANALISNKNQGFAITVVVCVIVDLLSQFMYGTQESNSRAYKWFLRKNVPGFSRKIKPPLKSYRHINKHGWKVEYIKDCAEAFWQAFRCGVVHSAMILDYGRISGEDIVGAGRVINIRRWGKKNREVAVNPFLLLKNTEQAFDRYIESLLNSANKKLRQKFAKKFYRSFGEKIKP